MKFWHLQYQHPTKFNPATSWSFLGKSLLETKDDGPQIGNWKSVKSVVGIRFCGNLNQLLELVYDVDDENIERKSVKYEENRRTQHL